MINQSDIDAATIGLQRHASTAAAQASNALMARHRKIDELEMCIEANLEEIPAPGLDVFCGECGRNEWALNARRLAEKIYEKGWMVVSLQTFHVECDVCLAYQEPESNFARQYQSDSGGVL